jgi:hypothetical protein
MRSYGAKSVRSGCIRFRKDGFLLIDNSADRYVDETHNAFLVEWISSPDCVRLPFLGLKTFQMIRIEGGQVTSKPIMPMRASLDILILIG